MGMYLRELIRFSFDICNILINLLTYITGTTNPAFCALTAEIQAIWQTGTTI